MYTEAIGLHRLPCALKLLNDYFECSNDQKEIRSSFLRCLKKKLLFFFNKCGSVKSRKQKIQISAVQRDFLLGKLGLKHKRFEVFTQKLNFQNYEKYLVCKGQKQNYKYQIWTVCLIIIIQEH